MAHKISEVEEERLYVLYYEDRPLHLVKGKWNDWRPSKKVYWKRGHAKSGITNLPNSIDKSKVRIVAYGPIDEGDDVDGNSEA